MQGNKPERAPTRRPSRRAAFGFGAPLKTALGPTISGVPSVAYTGSTGRPDSLSWNTPYSTPSAITARSPSASFLGGSAADCTCMTFCAASFSKYAQPMSRAIWKVAVSMVPE